MADRKGILLRLDPAVHDALARWAAADLRSTNAQIEFLLRQALIAAGRLPKRAGAMRGRGRPRAEPADAQPIEPAGTQPAGTQPADAQPAGTQPAGTQPADAQPAGTQPAGTAPGGGEPSSPAAGAAAGAPVS